MCDNIQAGLDKAKKLPRDRPPGPCSEVTNRHTDKIAVRCFSQYFNGRPFGQSTSGFFFGVLQKSG